MICAFEGGNLASCVIRLSKLRGTWLVDGETICAKKSYMSDKLSAHMVSTPENFSFYLQVSLTNGPN